VPAAAGQGEEERLEAKLFVGMVPKGATEVEIKQVLHM
jgi:hypothetical protein